MVELSGSASPWNDEELEGSVTDRFERQVDSDPGSLAVRVPGRELTYGDLDLRANEIAWAALEALGEGVEPVGLLLGDRLEAIAGILAAPKAGKAALFLDPTLPEERLRFLVADSGTRLIVCSGASLPLARSLASSSGVRLVDIEGLAAGRRGRPGLRARPDSPAVIVYTSGSTGRPKGVARSHRDVLWGSRQDARRNGMSGADRRLLVFSPASGAGVSIHYTLLNGASLFPFVLEKDGIAALRDWIASQEVTIYQSVPAVFRSVVRGLRPGERFPRLRIVRIGADTVRREDLELFQRHFLEPCLLSIEYASTEAGFVASRFIGASDRFEEGPIAVGRPSDGVTVRLLDERGREVMPGDAGEITVTSRHVADGYWRRPELTRERFGQGPPGGLARTFRTGDLGRFGPDGMLFHLGRNDLQVKVRGNRVEIEEVEAALRELPDVEEAAVAAHALPGGESRLVGYLVWRGRPASAREIRAGLSRTLPDYMVPAAFVALSTLPLTARGRVDRAALRPPDTETGAEEGRSAFAGPRDDVERRLAAIWDQLLGTRSVDIRSDFFELGGNSLLAAELFAEIERRTGKYLPLSSFLGASTIELLAEKLREASPGRWPSLVPIQPRGSRPPFFCVSWADGEVLSYAPLAARLGFDRPVYGLRRERLEDGRPSLTRVEEIAAHYVGEIRSLQPHGPYLLGGLSIGGAIAFEMARQLVAAGQEVGALVLMEPAVPDGIDGGPEEAHSTPPLGRVQLLAEKVRWYWTKWRLFENAERAAVLQRKGRKMWTGIRKVAGSWREGPAPSSDVAPAASDLLSRRDRTHVDRYSPEAYAGRAILFLAAHRRFHDDPLRVWQALVPAGLDVRVVPGFHESIIQEPFVRVLAAEVERCLSGRRPDAG